VIPFIPGESNLHKFDHNCSLFVHFGLFFFALCNAGVQVTIIGLTTLNIAVALVFGKFLGIFCFTLVGIKLFRLSLPDGMKNRDLSLTSLICGAGLTVALFVAELAFKDEVLKGEAKLGALLSVVVAPVAICIAKVAGVRKPVESVKKDAYPVDGYEFASNVTA
jgi:NhaA family Na+:H+ antiporter